MKIARIIYEWPHPWIGLAPAPYGLTKAQSKLGHNVTVFCARWPKAGPVEQVDNVKIHSFLRAPIRGTALITTAPFLALYFVIWRLFNKTDVYHMHGHIGLYVYIYKLLFGFLDKTPIVAHFHICAKAREEDTKKAGKKIMFLTKFIEWPLHKLSDSLAVKLASAYIFVGGNVLEDVVNYYGADRKKCFLIESGVDTDIFTVVDSVQKNNLKKELNFKASDVLVLNVGMFVDRKNIHLLVESLKFLPENFKLILVGKGESKYIQKLKEIIEKEQLSKRVFFMGEKTWPETATYFKASDIFVLPSAYEGFPKVVLEALSCGVPVLASGFKLPENIKGLFELEKHDTKFIADKILEIVTQKGRVDSLFVQSHYSWDQRAQEVDKIYNRLK